MVRLTIPMAYTDSYLESPYYQETLDAWDIRFLKRGYPRIKIGECIQTDIEYLNVADFVMVKQLPDVDVKYFNPYVEIAEADFDTNTPEGLVNSVVAEVWDNETDPENPTLVSEVRQKTWREWIVANHYADLIEGYYYFPVRFGNINAGSDISDTDILLVYNSEAATLVDEKPEIDTEDVE